MNRIFELFKQISEFIDPNCFDCKLTFRACGSGYFQISNILICDYPEGFLKQDKQAQWNHIEEGVVVLEKILKQCIKNNLKLLPEAIDIILKTIDCKRNSIADPVVQNAYRIVKMFKVQLEKNYEDVLKLN